MHATAYDCVITAGACAWVSTPATPTANYHPDFDNDADVDLADFVVFRACCNGPNRPPTESCPWQTALPTPRASGLPARKPRGP